MRIFRLRKTQTVPAPLAEVFSFFQRPENLARLTPPSLGFEILTPSPVPMGKGSLIDYTVRVLGWPLRWTSFIAEYDPPRRFVDVQLKGPYSFWHHAHAFEQRAEGTIIEDDVHYALPGGPLAGLLHGFVRRRLESIFEYRRRAAAELFLSGPSPVK